MRPAAGPIPGSAIPSRLINPAGFDKAKPPAVQRSLTMRPPLAAYSQFAALLTQFSQDAFTTRYAATLEIAAETKFR
jgi:hypothetical protein